MASRIDFERDLSYAIVKPAATRVVILCAGRSLDAFDLTQIRSDTDVVITVNSTLCHYPKSDYQMGIDERGLRNYHHKLTGQPWITRSAMRKVARELKMKHIVIEDVQERAGIYGSGAEAFYWAFFLDCVQTIKSVIAVGFETIGWASDAHTQHTFYARCLAKYVLADQKHLVIPAKNQQLLRPFMARYVSQSKGVLDLMERVPTFARKIQWCGYLDYSKIRHGRLTLDGTLQKPPAPHD